MPDIFVDIILPPIPRVMQLLAEIEKVKDAQLAGYAKGGGGSSAATNEKIQLNLNALAALDAADFYNDGMLCVKCVNMCHLFLCHNPASTESIGGENTS